MLEAPLPAIGTEPWRSIVMAYAPASRRNALAALLALDERLANIVQTTTQPALGQLRLAWWREALARLDTQPPPAEPVLQALAASVLPAGITGESLVPIVHGWEVLVEEAELGPDALQRYSEGRARLFTGAGAVLGAAVSDPVEEGGRGWALADLAVGLGASGEAREARVLAALLVEKAAAARWSRNGRALGALVHLARRELRVAAGSASRTRAARGVARLLWHRLTGR